jgi:hypothetical protein
VWSLAVIEALGSKKSIVGLKTQGSPTQGATVGLCQQSGFSRLQRRYEGTGCKERKSSRRKRCP